jgi:hypothetical protein
LSDILGSLTSEEIGNAERFGPWTGLSWINKPIGRAMFLGQSVLCSQATTPSGAMPYPVYARIEDQIPYGEALSGAAEKFGADVSTNSER